MKVKNLNKIKDYIARLSSLTNIFEQLLTLEDFAKITLTDKKGNLVKFAGTDDFNEMLMNVFSKRIDNGYADLSQLVDGEPSIINTIRVNHFDAMKKKNWDKTYWYVDIHDTILKSTYSQEISNVFFPEARETLQLLSDDPSVVLILYTCSHPGDVKKYMEFFSKEGIIFDYDFTNTKPEIDNTNYGYYDDKPYANVILDDKAGFNGEKDWGYIKKMMRKFDKVNK